MGIEVSQLVPAGNCCCPRSRFGRLGSFRKFPVRGQWFPDLRNHHHLACFVLFFGGREVSFAAGHTDVVVYVGNSGRRIWCISDAAEADVDKVTWCTRCYGRWLPLLVQCQSWYRQLQPLLLLVVLFTLELKILFLEQVSSL